MLDKIKEFKPTSWSIDNKTMPAPLLPTWKIW